MLKKAGNIFIAVFFLLFIFFFMGWSLIQKDRKVSELEGRPLALRPAVLLDQVKSGEFFNRFGNYYNDQFPLRDNWIAGNAMVDKQILKKNYIRDVYISKDGYLIEPVNPVGGKKTAEKVNQKINEFSLDLKRENVSTYFALAPNKSTVMENKLPNYIESHANDLSNQLIKGFSKDVHAIDLRDAVEPHLNENNMYFYTDHHWKPKAAYYAYTKIINTIAKNYPSVGEPMSMSQFNWEEYPKDFYGSEARKTTAVNVAKHDTVTIVKSKKPEKPMNICFRGSCGQQLYNMDVLKQTDEYTNRYVTYFSGDVPEGIIRNPNVHNNLRVLILKDSYANSMIQFMVRNFHETRVLDLRHYKYMGVKDYIKKNKIDIVVFVHNINSILITPEFLNL